MTISRSTAGPAWRRSRKLRLRPPSNRITATASLMIGCCSAPKSRCGSIRPVTGPASTPAISISAIAGLPVRHAIHCAPMPSSPISASLTSIESKISDCPLYAPISGRAWRFLGSGQKRCDATGPRDGEARKRKGPARIAAAGPGSLLGNDQKRARIVAPYVRGSARYCENSWRPPGYCGSWNAAVAAPSWNGELNATCA